MLAFAARICGIGVDAKDLLRTRAPLGKILGLDMSACNTLLCPQATDGSGPASIGLQSWQIGQVEELTEPGEFITFSTSSPGKDMHSEGWLTVSAAGSLNAVICWMEYKHDCHQTSWPPVHRPPYPHAWSEAVVILPECILLHAGNCHSRLKVAAAWRQGQFNLQLQPC